MRPLLLIHVFLIYALNYANGDQWMVHLEGNAADAEQLALEHNLASLGEILPNSNLYHFALKSEHLWKRSAIDKDELVDHIHHKLSTSPKVKKLEHQKYLRRSKRMPLSIEDEDEFLLVRKRQTAPSGPVTCYINTVRTETKESKRCVFPFSYKGKTYTKCTADNSGNDQPWCATQVKANGEVISGQWGDCDPESLSCFVGNEQPASQPQTPRGPPPPPPGLSFPRQRLIPSGLPPANSIPRNNVPRQRPPMINQNALPFLGTGGLPLRPQGGRLPLQTQPAPGLQSQFRPLQQLPGTRDNQAFLSFLNSLNGRPPLKQKEEFVGPEVSLDDLKTKWNDPMWTSMWFLNRGNDADGNGLDMNVEEAWEDGVTGKGVVVTILDDGVERSHPDLEDNYDPEASIDLNDNDDDPSPRYEFTNFNKHGTRCAGQVAAKANNSLCSVGIAYDSKIGGVRILDGAIVDALEARALSYNRDHIDIYSASWGPDDDGKTVDGPGPLARLALRQGVEKGRKGLGSIFVWASGNGGKGFDNCNADGFTTSVYTLSVSSTSEGGLIPWYSEPCSSSLATTYSSGSTRLRERKIATTDLRHGCTKSHTGTSASSPMAAGIIALVLEANPNLSWRDVQHIVVRTARPRGNLKAEDWSTNGVGLQFSHSYGFGLMDAGKMVKMAKKWETVPEQLNCTSSQNSERLGGEGKVVNVKAGSEESIPFKLETECESIKFMEHLQLHIQLRGSTPRGEISVLLRSPSGTVSTLLGLRPNDDIRTGLDLFRKWPMMSVHFWGENPTGEWTLLIRNRGDRPVTLNDFSIQIYGTETDPQPNLPVINSNVEKPSSSTSEGPVEPTIAQVSVTTKPLETPTAEELPELLSSTRGFEPISLEELAELAKTGVQDEALDERQAPEDEKELTEEEAVVAASLLSS